LSNASSNDASASDPELARALFVHEYDLIGNLRRFPLVARYRLDRLRVKLQLDRWQQLDYKTRREFCVAPFATPAEQADLERWLQEKMRTAGHARLELQEPEPIADFRDTASVPESVTLALARFELTIDRARWSELSELARFGLAKLSRPGHENRRLGPLIDDLFHREQGRDHPSISGTSSERST
jgi:hypothetical protein